MTSTRYQLNPVPFTEEYRPDLLGSVASSTARDMPSTKPSGSMRSTVKKPRPKGKWKSPLFFTASGITAPGEMLVWLRARNR